MSHVQTASRHAVVAVIQASHKVVHGMRLLRSKLDIHELLDSRSELCLALQLLMAKHVLGSSWHVLSECRHEQSGVWPGHLRL